MIDHLLSAIRDEAADAALKAAAVRDATERELFELLTRATVDGISGKSEARLKKLVADANISADTLAGYVAEIRALLTHLDGVADATDAAAEVAHFREEVGKTESEAQAYRASRQAEVRIRVSASQNAWGAGKVDEFMKETEKGYHARDAKATEARTALHRANMRQTQAKTAAAAVEDFRRRRPILTAVVESYRQPTHA